jgi:hypothetical protein
VQTVCLLKSAGVLAGPALHVELGILDVAVERLEPAVVGEFLELERGEMDDVGRLAAGEQRRHRVGIGAALDLGPFDLDARMRRLEFLDDRGPPIAGTPRSSFCQDTNLSTLPWACATLGMRPAASVKASAAAERNNLVFGMR